MAITKQDLIERNIDNQKPLIVSDGEVIFYHNGNAVIPHYKTKGLHNSLNNNATSTYPGVIISDVKELDIFISQIKVAGIKGELPDISTIKWSLRGLLESHLCEVKLISIELLEQLRELNRLSDLLELNGCVVMDSEDKEILNYVISEITDELEKGVTQNFIITCNIQIIANKIIKLLL